MGGEGWVNWSISERDGRSVLDGTGRDGRRWRVDTGGGAGRDYTRRGERWSDRTEVFQIAAHVSTERQRSALADVTGRLGCGRRGRASTEAEPAQMRQNHLSGTHPYTCTLHSHLREPGPALQPMNQNRVPT